MQKIINFFSSIDKNLLRIIFSTVIFIVIYFFKTKISNASLNLFCKLFMKNQKNKIKSIKESLLKPIEALLSVIAISSVLFTLSPLIGVKSVQIAVAILKIGGIITICWGLVNYLSNNLFLNLYVENNSNSKLDATAIRFISNILKIAVVCLGIVMIASELGYNINGLITGLGIGGLAVSLAAKDTLQSILSGFIIIFDKPFVIGDVIETGAVKGTVEDITMRSTRIRSVDDTEIIVPNSQISVNNIVNFSRLSKKLIQTTISLTYDTDSEKIKNIKREILSYLEKSNDILNDVIRVSFSLLDSSSQNISIFCYSGVISADEYVKVIEDLNFEIKKIVEKNNANFAYPSTSVYVKNEKEL